MGIVWIVLIGFVAGLIARLISPGPNNPSGFILTTVLGVVGAFLATFIGQAIGWYRADQGAGFISATVGAVIVLFVWNRLVAARSSSPTPALAHEVDLVRILNASWRDKSGGADVLRVGLAGSGTDAIEQLPPRI